MIIETRGLRKYYWLGREKVAALDGVNLGVEAGEFVSIVGPSGSGKSTLLNVLGCLDAPTGGAVFLDGEQVDYKNKRSLVALRRKVVGFVFQTFNLLPTLNAVENVVYPMIFNTREKKKGEGRGKRRGEGRSESRSEGRSESRSESRSERRAKARRLLERVGLGSRVEHLPSELSGGEQQRIAVARALANDPKIILADEPTGNLDSRTGAKILELLKRLNDEEGKTVVMVTHDLESAKRTGKVVEILDGRISDGRLDGRFDRRLQ